MPRLPAFAKLGFLSLVSLAFLIPTGMIGLPPNPADPASQYTNLNVQQSFKVVEYVGHAPRVLIDRARVAPINIGPKSTGNMAQYEALANAAIHTVGPAPHDIRVFAGPRDDGFYADLEGAFDLIDVRNPGVDQ